MATSAACECGAEEQTLDHVVLQSPIHRPPHGLHGLTVPDNETIEWLLNSCLEIYSAAKQWMERTGSNDEEEAAYQVNRTRRLIGRCQHACVARSRFLSLPVWLEERWQLAGFNFQLSVRLNTE